MNYICSNKYFVYLKTNVNGYNFPVKRVFFKYLFCLLLLDDQNPPVNKSEKKTGKETRAKNKHCK